MKLPRWVARSGSFVWSKVNQTARFAVRQGWVETTRLPVRVIGVGNLQAGGSGKTPLVIEIARQALARGLRVCILTRGYRSYWEEHGGVLRPHDPRPDPSLCGDEAALIHEQVPEAWIGVGADRVAQFVNVSREADGAIDLVILDDGLQHWKIEKDLNVVALTDADFGDRLFRESFEVLKPEDLLVLTKGSAFPAVLPEQGNRVEIEYTYPASPNAGPYLFACGLGDPERARSALIQGGYDILTSITFADHHAYSKKEIEALLEKAALMKARVLVTGKDAVKWYAQGIAPERFEVAEPTIRVRSGEALWNARLWGRH